jgi:aminopeptidase N
MTRRIILSLFFLLSLLFELRANPRQDSLLGQSKSTGRFWWDVKRYYLNFDINLKNKSISGSSTMRFVVKDSSSRMQIDLQQPMQVDSIHLSCIRRDSLTHHELHLEFSKVNFHRNENVIWVESNNWLKQYKHDSLFEITVYFHGVPHEAVNAPWDGGFVWTKDESGKPWVAVACQGDGASIWFPCKDDAADEPDELTNITITYPDYLYAVSNGRLVNEFNKQDTSGKRVSVYSVRNPINVYDITFYLGDYFEFGENIKGAAGELKLRYFALKCHEKQARNTFTMAAPMIHCFENWFGPYPFYQDGYKLVEAPYLGMEHQSAIAYGNKFKLGYLGMDRSFSGVGLKFDYILVHESAHEWFGNSITANDVANDWIQEGWTTYAEGLYVECLLGKGEALKYIRGEWKNIDNDRPILGQQGIHAEGSGDRYDKGAAIVHMIRQQMNDDAKFKKLLQSLNKKFYHKTISEADFESYIIKESGLPLAGFFDQYLRTNIVPLLEYKVSKKNGIWSVDYRYQLVVDGFKMRIPIIVNGKEFFVEPTTDWQTINGEIENGRGPVKVSVSPDYYVEFKEK